MKFSRWITLVLWWGLCLAVLVACTRRYPGGDIPPFALPGKITTSAPTETPTGTVNLPLIETSPITGTASSTVTLPVISSGVTTTLPVTPGVGVTLTLPVIGSGVSPEPSTGMTITLPLVSVVVTPTISPVQARQAAQRAAKGESLFMIRGGTPAGVQNFIHQDAGCNWAGVVGQAFDQSGAPLSGLVVEIAGFLEGKEFLGLALTGSSHPIGPGGFEIVLKDQAVASQGTLYIQLFDLQGQAISRAAPINTYADCNQNTVLVNFVEVPMNRKGFLPFISTGSRP